MLGSKIKYSELQKSDFYQSFKLYEVASSQLESLIIKTMKTGDFQDYVDLEFHVNKRDEIEKALLLLDRSWIGNTENVNLFGKGIAKEFIHTMAPPNEKSKVESLVHHLLRLRGTKDVAISIRPPRIIDEPSPEVGKVLDVYLNLQQSAEVPLKHSKFVIENIDQDGKPRLSIMWLSN